MGSKTINTPEGMMIVDEDFDESTMDTSSMLPEELRRATQQETSPTTGQDVLVVNGEEHRGQIKTYSIYENRKTKQKVIKVILVS